jgi:hypothetical protein
MNVVDMRDRLEAGGNPETRGIRGSRTEAKGTGGNGAANVKPSSIMPQNW